VGEQLRGIEDGFQEHELREGGWGQRDAGYGKAREVDVEERTGLRGVVDIVRLEMGVDVVDESLGEWFEGGVGGGREDAQADGFWGDHGLSSLEKL